MYQTVVVGRDLVDEPPHVRTGSRRLFSRAVEPGSYPNPVSTLALTANDDIMVGGVDAVTNASGTVVSTQVLARLDSANFLTGSGPRLMQAARSPTRFFPGRHAGTTSPSVSLQPNRASMGLSASVVENATTATNITSYIDNAAALGADKTTLWLVGVNTGPTQLNPWSATTTTLPGDNRSSSAPRMTAPRLAPGLTTHDPVNPAHSSKILVDPNGDLIVIAATAARGGATGPVSLNGKEILGAQDGTSIFKVAAGNGAVHGRSRYPRVSCSPPWRQIAARSWWLLRPLLMLCRCSRTRTGRLRLRLSDRARLRRSRPEPTASTSWGRSRARPTSIPGPRATFRAISPGSSSPSSPTSDGRAPVLAVGGPRGVVISPRRNARCRGQVVRQRSAKPSFPGSNPGGTSRNLADE